MTEENGEVVRRWPLLVVLAGAVLVAAFGPVTCSMLTTDSKPTKSSGVRPESYARLTKILSSLRGAWSPSDRQRILDDARARADDLEPSVRFVLEQAEGADFIPACNLAVAIELHSVRSVLVAQARALQSVAGTAALRAAHALVPYEWDEIAPFLDGSPILVVAALECAKTIEGRDNVRIARLLASAEPSIREAAGAALGPSPGSEAMAVVVELAESPRPEVAGTAQRAFVQLDWEGAAAGWVGNLFARADADVRRLVLERIVREARPWLPPHDLWRVAREDGLMAHRTLAFQGLEACGGFDSKDLLAAQRQLPALLRYHAARCAIADRKQEAAAILLDLVEARDTGEATAEQARVEARVLLAGITGTPIHEEPSTWREWLRRNPDFDASGVRNLMPPR